MKAMIEIQERRCLGEERVLELVSNKITEVGDEMERLRRMQRELERLREVGAGLKTGELHGEF